jgi:asparagine synthase (glutamine-hydrolysing)
MCGICGGVSSHKIEIYDMVESIKHRGPDFQDVFIEEPIYLAHARLSILDLSSDANQPMISRDGQYVLVYNGEVYNFQSIKKTLQSLGHLFKTSSDTEVILEGFIEWGIKLFEKLNGMFAFSIYDKKNQKIYIVRDRFGIKPLYYYYDNKTLLFASEIKSLLSSRLIPKELSYQGLYEYMHFSTTVGESTFYRDIKKLKSGEYIEYNLETWSLNISSYKSICDVPLSNDFLDEAIYKIRDLFEKSVKRQLISDVPVGIFLSGGIDSTAITAVASKYYNGKLKTFSAGFDFDKGFNELPNARFISEKFNTDHYEFYIRGSDTISILERVNYYFDQPFADAANIPLYLMSQELKGKHKVILQGDGGDELFAGYNYYLRVKNERLFKLFSHIIISLTPLIPKSSKYYRMLRSMYAITQKDKALIPARFYSQEMINESSLPLFKKRYRNNLSLVNPFNRSLEIHSSFKDKNLDLLQELLYSDISLILPDQYLEKVDRATMANSLEVRVPFLDNDLAEYVISLPSKYKIIGKEKKYLLKQAFNGIVPDKILYGQKRGFGVPFSYWLRSSMKDLIRDEVSSSNIYTNKVIKMIDEHILGKRDHGFILWKILNLSMWLNQNKDIRL